MPYYSRLRGCLITLCCATFLGLSIWIVDYVLLPPIWSMVTASTNLNSRSTAAAQALQQRHLAIYQQWFSDPVAQPTGKQSGSSAKNVDNVLMIKISAGPFRRGFRQGSPDERFEQVIAVDEFFIDRYEVTQQAYHNCVEVGICMTPRSTPAVHSANQPNLVDTLPVTGVTWRDAAAYCHFRNKRLPSEAEWEKAARGPQAALYPWGDGQPSTQANFALGAGWVTAGGIYPEDRSRYGVYDMAGNVREWVADWYQWDYYAVAPTQNPLGPERGMTKVVRGGSWNSDALQLRATRRANVLPTTFDANLGFRCASSTFPPIAVE